MKGTDLVATRTEADIYKNKIDPRGNPFEGARRRDYPMPPGADMFGAVLTTAEPAFDTDPTAPLARGGWYVRALANRAAGTCRWRRRAHEFGPDADDDARGEKEDDGEEGGSPHGRDCDSRA